MLELAAVTLVAAVATTFAVDILRPTAKVLMRRRSKPQTVNVDGTDVHVVRAH
jgi:hypothetical protein